MAVMTVVGIRTWTPQYIPTLSDTPGAGRARLKANRRRAALCLRPVPATSNARECQLKALRVYAGHRGVSGQRSKVHVRTAALVKDAKCLYIERRA